MGREQKRQRARVAKQLERRLHRAPTDEEIEKALAELRETRRKTVDRKRTP